MSKNYWTKICEFIVRGKAARGDSRPTSPGQPSGLSLPERPEMDVEENDRVLATTGEGTPVYRTLMNYAYVHVENNLTVAMDPSKDREARFDFLNRAAGVTAFIADVENSRVRLREEMLAKQKLDQQAAARQKK